MEVRKRNSEEDKKLTRFSEFYVESDATSNPTYLLLTRLD